MTDEQKIKYSRILLEQGYITPEQYSYLVVEDGRIVSDADFPVKFEGEKVHIWHHGYSYPPMTYNLNRILDDSRGELEMSVTQLNININMLKDTLYYLSQDVQEPLAKKQGVIVGVVGGLMAAGMTYNEAVSIVNKNLPPSADLSCVPDAWKGDIRKEE